MNILVVNDENKDDNQLSYTIDKNFLDVRVYKTYGTEETLNRLKEKNINLIFIESHSNKKWALKIAKQIRSCKEYELTGIVFITDDIVHIIDAFKSIHCYDYIIKPYKEEDIVKIVQVFANNFNKNKRKSSVFDLGNGLVKRLYHDEIKFIEYKDRGCSIYYKGETLIWKSKSLTKALESLDDRDIIQTHKSFAVNINKIDKIQKISEKSWEIEFYNTNEKALLGYRYKQGLMGRLKTWNY